MNGLPEIYDEADAPRARVVEFNDADLMDLRDEQEVVDGLMYASYAANRAMCPGREPQSFARFYPDCDVEAFERRYQAERT